MKPGQRITWINNGETYMGTLLRVTPDGYAEATYSLNPRSLNRASDIKLKFVNGQLTANFKIATGHLYAEDYQKSTGKQGVGSVPATMSFYEEQFKKLSGR